MSLQKNMRFAIGVDVGGSHVCSAVVSLATGEIAGCVSETPLDSGADAAAILDILSSNILQSFEPVKDGTVEGVGLAFPGPFDYPNGISKVNGVGKYERIYGLDLKTSLSSRLRSRGVDSFRFLNDASAFALGECAGGAGRGADRVVAITLGTGVGSGFVCGNRLVESGDEVPENGWVYHLPFEDGIADEAFSTRWICRRYREISGMEIAGAKEVAARCAAGDRNAADLFPEYGRRLAGFIAPLLAGFRADMLVLGGNISRAWPFFGPELEKGLEERGCRAAVRTSLLRDRAAMIGAASLFI